VFIIEAMRLILNKFYLVNAQSSYAMKKCQMPKCTKNLLAKSANSAVAY
jgi:hypothetical protein